MPHPRTIAVEAIAVLAGAVIGTLLLDILNWLFFDGPFLGLVTSPGHLVVALITVGIYAFYYRSLPPTPAALAAFFTGVILPAVLHRYAFDSVLGWGGLLFLYVLFSLASLFTYRFVHANGFVRTRMTPDEPTL
ncbi:hypothetical protein [Mangrovicella endophytica]|uniref:hypothetical protein n=1 Tax=Mangrovicella endophytica TaxID=2066697 RepID=UPI000C9EA00F|nr:hypothetical protein [Mangrovicella endophytica]